MTQMQLLKMALDPQDVVYTPDYIAADMVSFFQPSGKILEPSKGGGVFMKYLPPETDWCEIAEGKDFFAYNNQVDWIVGNPPFKLFYEFMEHSYKVASDIVYLLPADKPFNVFKTVEMIFKYGGIVHARFYGNGSAIGIPEIHRPVTAFHFRRGYRGAMSFSFAEPRPTPLAPDRLRRGRAVANPLQSTKKAEVSSAKHGGR